MTVTVVEFQLRIPKDASWFTRRKLDWYLGKMGGQLKFLGSQVKNKDELPKLQSKRSEFEDGDFRVISVSSRYEQAYESIDAEIKELSEKVVNQMKKDVEKLGCVVEFKEYSLDSHDIT